MIRNLVVAFLSRQGHQCVTASNGIEALSSIHRDKFDAVITDIVMPQMDGITLMKELLSLYPQMPIMVMTGNTKEYPAELAIWPSAHDFMEKPFSYGEFILRFNKMMREHESLCKVREKRDEMIFNLHRESSEKIEELKKKIETLERKSYHFVEPDLWR